MIADSGFLIWKRCRGSRSNILKAVLWAVSCVAGLSCSLSLDADDASPGQLPPLQHKQSQHVTGGGRCQAKAVNSGRFDIGLAASGVNLAPLNNCMGMLVLMG